MAEHGNDLVILMEFHGRTCVELMNPSRLRKLSRIDNPFLAATVYIYIYFLAGVPCCFSISVYPRIVTNTNT